MDPRQTIPTTSTPVSGVMPVVDPRPAAANVGVSNYTTGGHNPTTGRTNVFGAPYHAAAPPVTAAGMMK
jgi:hypothetical protein